MNQVELDRLKEKKIKLLNNGWLELQDIMGDDLAIVNAARVSFLQETKGIKKDRGLISFLMANRHTGPFEQVEFKFRVHASLVVWWQWIRHRMMSYNGQSGRYIVFKPTDCHIPDPSMWRKQAKNNKQGSDGEIQVLGEWGGKYFTAILKDTIADGFRKYNQALKAKMAKEQARLFLPAFALNYTFIVKVDAHNLMHFLSLRMAPDAQYEIRVYAQAIYEHFFKPVLPWTSEAFERFILNKGNARINKADIFKSLKNMMMAYKSGQFKPDDYGWYVEGSELFVNNGKGVTMFNKECGEMAHSICDMFDVKPEQV